MNVSKTSCGLIAIAGAALAQLAGALPASAQSSPQVFFAPSTPATPVVASVNAGGEDRQVITVIEDGTSATITIVDGKVESAVVDGKEVSTDRVRTRKDRYEILDDQGEVIATVQRLSSTSGAAGAGGGATITTMPASGARAGRVLQTTPSGQTRYRTRAGQAVAPAAPAPPAPPAPPQGLPYAVVEDQPAPKVMIGVNLAEPDGALLGHFGLKPGEATMFSGVYEGLPAGSAGIGVYDIVIKVNGQAPAGPEDIRQVLRKLDPGDTVKFTILQHGQQRDVNVKVEPYSADRLSQAKVDSISVASDPFMGGGQWRSFAGGGASPARALNEEEMKKLMVEAELMASKGGVDRLVGRLAPPPGQGGDPTVVPLLRLDEMRAKEAQARAEAMEAAVRAESLAKTLADRAAQMEKRSVELKERSDKNADLEKRLDRLERMLERLLDEKSKDRP